MSEQNLLYFFGILTIIFRGNDGFFRQSPIIWETSASSIVTKGMGEAYYSSQFESPCESMRNETEQESEIKKNCDNNFHLFFIDQIKNVCPEISNMTMSDWILPTKISREKRNPVLGIIAVGWAVAVTAGVGYAVYQTTENKWNIRTNKEKIDAIERQVRAIRTELKDAITTSKDIGKSIELITEILKELNATMNTRFNDVPLSIWDISYVQGQLLRINTYAFTFVRLWRLGKISPGLWHHLNLDVPTTISSRYDPYNLIIPQSCAIDVKEKRLFFKTLRYNPSIDYSIVVANPFTLLQKNGTLYCEQKYKGPTWLYFAKNDTCIIPVKAFERIESDRYSEPPFGACLDVDKDLAVEKSFWEHGHCYHSNKIAEKSPIQIKSVSNGWMIYCFPQRIRVDETDVNCPNNVMHVQSNVVVSFRNKSLVDIPSHKFGHVDHYEPVQNHIANKFIFGDLDEFYKELKRDLNVTRKDIIRVEEDEKKTDEAMAWFEWPIGNLWGLVITSLTIIISVLGLVVIICICYRCKKLKYRSILKRSSAIEMNEM